MSELKSYKLFHRASALTSPEFLSVVEFGNGDEVYLKSEADKVIAELEESHKKEVEQLLMEIVGLKEQYKDMDVTHTVHIAKMNAKIDKLEEDVAWNKYKRCLAMASYWLAVSYQCVDDKHRRSAERHHRKWLELAERFK